MPRFFHKTLTLNHLVLFLAVSAAAITLVNSFYASYQVQQQQLIKHDLERNLAYATKLATTTNDFLISAQQQLAYAAGIIQQGINDDSFLLREADRLRLQTDGFNSVVIADHQGRVLATSPDSLQIIGRKLTSIGAQQALANRTAQISPPYISVKDNLLVFISHPLFDREGHYLGYVGGSIYLKKPSFLNNLLGNHFYKDGSYLYVVDTQKRLIYHPEKQRVGETIEGNPVIEAVLRGNSGSQSVVNSLDAEMLAGYAPIPASGWGIVSQRPLARTLSPMDHLMEQVVYRSLPLGIFTFIAIWLLSRLIAQPLQQLADTARTMDQPGTHSRLLGIRSWYHESSELRQAMLKGVNLMQQRIGHLQHAASTDPLTGVYNRRSLDALMLKLEERHIPFSVLALDIDHFKQVNDHYGHAAGDKALTGLTDLLKQLSRDNDIIARIGGEEFVIVLPNIRQDDALQIAERIRQRVAETRIEPVGHIYISVGISSLSRPTETCKQVLKQADDALYQAKRAGRNRCIVFLHDKLQPEPKSEPEHPA